VKTERIGLATGVTCPSVRYHPTIIAQAAATLAIISDGRFTLGVGAGERLNKHVTGLGFPARWARHERLREALEIIRLLWRGGYRSYDGRRGPRSGRLHGLLRQGTRRPTARAHPGSPMTIAAGRATGAHREEARDAADAAEDLGRLSRSDPAAGGIRRRRCGRGFRYLSPSALVTDPGILARIKALAIPPAWDDVWICTDPRGHIQAVGTDAAGRRQYRYHDLWREQRDPAKHDRMPGFGAALPRLREAVDQHLEGCGLSRDRVLAAAVRLVDLSFFRPGGEEYARPSWPLWAWPCRGGPSPGWCGK
jgi:hypothetical protein